MRYGKVVNGDEIFGEPSFGFIFIVIIGIIIFYLIEKYKEK